MSSNRYHIARTPTASVDNEATSTSSKFHQLNTKKKLNCSHTFPQLKCFLIPSLKIT